MTTNSTNSSDVDSTVQSWETVGKNKSIFIQWYRLLIPTICTVGLLGNLANLALIIHKRRKRASDATGRSANNSMLALSLSDLFFCLCVLPQTFSATYGYCEEACLRFVLYYRVYGIAFINLFLMSGTATVTMTACMRYVAITSPIDAKNSRLLRYSHLIIVLVYAFCAIFTMPHFIFLDVVKLNMTSPVDIYCVAYRFHGATQIWLQR